MEYRFNDLYQPVKTPAKVPGRPKVDEFGLMADPSYYPFGAGNPSPDTFPVDAFREIASTIFSDSRLTSLALNYGNEYGYAPLREQTVAWNNQKYPGMIKASDNIMMTHGGLHGLALPATVILQKGDVVIVEDPTFGPSRKAFRLKGARIVGVPVLPDGMDLDCLEETIKANPTAKIIYIISAFQNPTGYTTSLEKRDKIYELAQRYDLLIIEDNPYGELRYSGDAIPPMKCMDTDGRVIYSGSYSKILSPGIRLGYTIADKKIIDVMCDAREDVHTGMLQQLIASEYINRYDFWGHIKDNCKYYQEKRDLMIECLDKYLPSCVSYSKPDGGLFLWLDLPQNVSSVDVMYDLLDKKVLVCDSNRFLLDHSRQGLRLNFSMPSKEKIETGIEIMCQALDSYFESNM